MKSDPPPIYPLFVLKSVSS